MDSGSTLFAKLHKFLQTIQKILGMTVIGMISASGVGCHDSIPLCHHLHQTQQLLFPGKHSRLIVQAKAKADGSVIHSII